MNNDIITGLLGEIYQCRDLRGDWEKTINLGKAQAGQSFSVKASLRETPSWKASNSEDRLKFGASKNIHFQLNTDPHVKAELVKFTNNRPSVVRSLNYGHPLSLKLAAGNYGLSFTVAGEKADYQIKASFI